MGNVGEYTDFQNGFAFKSKDFQPVGEYKVIKIKELKAGGVKFSEDTAYVNYSDGIEKYIVNEGDVLFALTGDPVSKPNPLSWVGRVSIYNEKAKAVLNQRVCKLLPKDTLNPKYLYYFFRNNTEFYQLAGKATGSASQANISTKTIADTFIDLPSIDYQNKVVAILYGIDSKIRCNDAINQNLLEQLLTLYALIIESDSNCSEVDLGSICDFQEGYVNPAQTHPEFFDGNIKWLRAVDINERFIINTSRTLTQIGFESAKKSAYLFPPNTIAISKSGTIGRLGIVDDYMCGNRAVIDIAPKNGIYLPFIYAFLKSKQSIFPDLAVGSVQKNLYVSLLEPLVVRMPQSDVLDAFCSTGNSLLDEMRNNCRENLRLEALRDSLLPQLMSGKLDVSDIDM